MTSDLQRRLRSLAVYCVGPRVDWEFMIDPLVGYFRTAFNDFWLTHDGDNSEGFASPADRRKWWEPRIADMQAWGPHGVPLDPVGRDSSAGSTRDLFSADS